MFNIKYIQKKNKINNTYRISKENMNLLLIPSLSNLGRITLSTLRLSEPAKTYEGVSRGIRACTHTYCNWSGSIHVTTSSVRSKKRSGPNMNVFPSGCIFLLRTDFFVQYRACDVVEPGWRHLENCVQHTALVILASIEKWAMEWCFKNTLMLVSFKWWFFKNTLYMIIHLNNSSFKVSFKWWVFNIELKYIILYLLSSFLSFCDAISEERLRV